MIYIFKKNYDDIYFKKNYDAFLQRKPESFAAIISKKNLKVLNLE